MGDDREYTGRGLRRHEMYCTELLFGYFFLYKVLHTPKISSVYICIPILLNYLMIVKHVFDSTLKFLKMRDKVHSNT